VLALRDKARVAYKGGVDRPPEALDPLRCVKKTLKSVTPHKHFLKNQRYLTCMSKGRIFVSLSEGMWELGTMDEAEGFFLDQFQLFHVLFTCWGQAGRPKVKNRNKTLQRLLKKFFF